MSSERQADPGQDLTSRAEQSQSRQSSWDENRGRGKGQRPELCSPRVCCHIKSKLPVPGGVQVEAVMFIMVKS